MAIPEIHQRFLDGVVARLKTDSRLLGVAVAGSYAMGGMDAFSDLDLVIVVREEDWAEVMGSRKEMAAGLGKLVAAFTGEHVGEPRLLVCLYEHPTLHVDFKFVMLDGLAQRVDDPVVVFDRDGRVGAAIGGSRGEYAELDWQWAEDRIWVWMHYAAMKLARGEVIEVANFSGFLWERVVGPMAKAVERRAGEVVTPGVRRLEEKAGRWVPMFEASLPRSLEKGEVGRAVLAVVELYCALRDDPRGKSVVRRVDAERVARGYWEEYVDGGPSGVR